MAIYITKKDKFIWLDVTDQMKCGRSKQSEIWLGHELYAIHDDDSDSLIESYDEIDEALELGLRICIEGGYLPKEYHPRNSWGGTSKKLIDGYWYVKLADLKLA